MKHRLSISPILCIRFTVSLISCLRVQKFRTPFRKARKFKENDKLTILLCFMHEMEPFVSILSKILRNDLEFLVNGISNIQLPC